MSQTYDAFVNGDLTLKNCGGSTQRVGFSFNLNSFGVLSATTRWGPKLPPGWLAVLYLQKNRVISLLTTNESALWLNGTRCINCRQAYVVRGNSDTFF